MSNYTCKKCGQRYQIDQSGEYQCQCGDTFHFDVPAAPVPVKLESDANTQICPFCKSSIPADAKKCAKCGEWVCGTAPKSRTTYITLAVLFGNWGIAEFYAGHYFVGLLLLILNILSFALEQSMVAGFVVVWFIALFVALLSNVGIENVGTVPETQIKKSDKVFFWIWIFFAAVVVLIFVFLLLYNFMK